MFASFCILATISFDLSRIGFLGADVNVALEALPKFSLIDFLGVVFFSVEIVNVSLTVSYINLASLTLSALSKVSTIRNFCDLEKCY